MTTITKMADNIRKMLNMPMLNNSWFTRHEMLIIIEALKDEKTVVSDNSIVESGFRKYLHNIEWVDQKSSPDSKPVWTNMYRIQSALQQKKTKTDKKSLQISCKEYREILITQDNITISIKL